MTDVADDTTPQLGGDLDGQGNYSLDNQSITNLASNGAGYVFDGTTAYIALSGASINLGENGSLEWNMALDGTQDCCVFGLDGAYTKMVVRYLSSTGALTFRPNADAAYVVTWTIAGLVDNINRHYVITKEGETANLHINGILETKTSNATTAGIDLLVEDYFVRGGEADFFAKGSSNKARLYNTALTATEVKDLYSNANIPFKYEGASQTALTTGSLVVGKEYIIDTFVAGDDFVNVGGTNVTGTVFTATGATPTTWTNGSSLRTQGNVADYNSAGVSDATWYDQSGNGNDGTVSGALVTGRPEERVVDTLRVDGAIIKALETPASAAAQGTVGQVVWDNGYIYICTATNTWKRVEIATW